MSESTTAGWVAGILLVHQSAGAVCILNKNSSVFLFFPPHLNAPRSSDSSWDAVIEDTVSWTPPSVHNAWALLCKPVPGFLLRGEAGVGWRRFDHLGECGPKWLLGCSAGRTTAADCRRTSVWLGLMNCLVEQNYIMLVFFKRIWQVLKYAGWCSNLKYDTAWGNR